MKNEYEIKKVDTTEEEYYDDLVFGEKIGMALMDTPMKRMMTIAIVVFVMIAVLIGNISYEMGRKSASGTSKVVKTVDITVEDEVADESEVVEEIVADVVDEKMETVAADVKEDVVVEDKVEPTSKEETKVVETKESTPTKQPENAVDNENYMYGLDLPTGDSGNDYEVAANDAPSYEYVIAPEVFEDIYVSSECTNHNLVLTDTEIIETCMLYNYVTDWFKCTNCGYRETYDHRAENNASSATMNAAANELISLVNNLRASKGLNTLWTDGSWDAWADKRADELTVEYGHNNWTNAIGDTYTLAENIAAGCESGADFFDAFCGSASHYNAMLLEDAVGIAVSISIDDNGTPYCAMCLIANY